MFLLIIYYWNTYYKANIPMKVLEEYLSRDQHPKFPVDPSQQHCYLWSIFAKSIGNLILSPLMEGSKGRGLWVCVAYSHCPALLCFPWIKTFKPGKIESVNKQLNVSESADDLVTLR
jgi:hypothetical protein